MAKKHRARLTDQAGLESFTIKASYGGAGIDYIYGTRDGKPELHAVDFDGDAIQATTAQAWLATRAMVPAEFVADAGPEVFAGWVASSNDSGWDADDSSRKADAATRDADMPAEHHQETKHATAAAAHRRAAADHEKTAALHDTEGREAGASGDNNSANDHKRQADESRAKQDKHEKQASMHDRKLKKLREPAKADDDKDGDAAGDKDGDGDGVKAGEVPDATPETATPAAVAGSSVAVPQSAAGPRPWEIKLQAIADTLGITGAQAQAIVFGVFPTVDDVLAMNPYHEGGSGRFTSGSGGAKKLQDQGANSASEVAAAASKSAHTFTGSHHAATQAHLDAAAVNEKVRQRSKAAFADAVARHDSLAAVAHSNEASNAEHNVNLHQSMAMEHDNKAAAEAQHAISTGLAGQLPAPVAEKHKEAAKSSLIGKAVGLLGRGAAATGRGAGNVVKYGGAAVAVGGVASAVVTGPLGLAVGVAGIGVATVGHGINRAFGGGKKSEVSPAAAPGAGSSAGPATQSASHAALANFESHAAGKASEAAKGMVDRLFAKKQPAAPAAPAAPATPAASAAPAATSGLVDHRGNPLRSSSPAAASSPSAAASRGSSANPYSATVVPEAPGTARGGSGHSSLVGAGDAAKRGQPVSGSTSTQAGRSFDGTLDAISRANDASRRAAGTSAQSGNVASGRGFADTLAAVDRAGRKNLPSPLVPGIQRAKLTSELEIERVVRDSGVKWAGSSATVNAPSFDNSRASNATSAAVSSLRQAAAKHAASVSRTATGDPRPQSRQLPYRPWEVAEFAQPLAGKIEAVAAAIAAVRSKPKAE